MPKSRNRTRKARTQPQRKPGKWSKWMAAIPVGALLIATVIGLFGAGR
jgi:hypothetical protein